MFFRVRGGNYDCPLTYPVVEHSFSQFTCRCTAKTPRYQSYQYRQLRIHWAQQWLQTRYDSTPNWLAAIWEDAAYLTYRSPVVLFSNTMAIRLSLDMNPRTWEAEPAVPDPRDRAALCVMESLYFRQLLIDENVAEVFRSNRPLSQAQFRRYYSMRIPQQGRDIISVNEPRHVRTVLLILEGAMAFVEVMVGESPAPPHAVRAVVHEAIRQLRQRTASSTFDKFRHSVGALTALPRDEAAGAFAALAALSQKNTEYLARIHKEMLTVVCMDDLTPIRNATEGLNVSALANPWNRWYDASMLQIVSQNGIAMYQGEHSPMDAVVSASTPIDVVTKYAVPFLDTDEGRRWRHGSAVAESDLAVATSRVSLLDWDIDDAVANRIQLAIAAHKERAKDCQVLAYRNASVGRQKFSSLGVHADFFIQAALHLTYYTLHNHVAAAYESASTRVFQQGRTETIRSMTPAMRQLIEAVVKKDPGASPAFAKAQSAHVQVSSDAGSGRGVDRHLLGLRAAMSALGLPQPRFFTAPCVQQAQSFLLSTSQMVGETFIGGFCHPYRAGYGACYYILQDEIRASLAAGADGAVATFAKTFTLSIERLISVAEQLSRDTPKNAGKL